MGVNFFFNSYSYRNLSKSKFIIFKFHFLKQLIKLLLKSQNWQYCNFQKCIRLLQHLIILLDKKYYFKFAIGTVVLAKNKIKYQKKKKNKI